MFRVQLCFDRPGAYTGTEENKRNAPVYDDRASAVGGVSVRQVPLTSVMDGVMTRSLLPLALGINRIVTERGWVVTFCKRVVKFDRPFSIVDLGGGDTDIADSSTHAHRKFPSVFWFREGQSEGELSERNESCLGVSAYQ